MENKPVVALLKKSRSRNASLGIFYRLYEDNDEGKLIVTLCEDTFERKFPNLKLDNGEKKSVEIIMREAK